MIIMIFNEIRNLKLKKASICPNEQARLNKLFEYGILDTKEEESFDQITQFAKQLCDSPIALISLIDANRQWFKSSNGLEARETPRDISFCGHAILGNELFIIENALKDERFKDNPLVVNPPHVIFYAGAPLITSDGLHLGTVCVIDHKPKVLNELQKDGLKFLAKTVINLLDHRLLKYQYNQNQMDFASVQKLTSAGIWELEIGTGKTSWSKQIYEIYKIPYETPTNLIDGLSYYAEKDQSILRNLINRCIENEEPFDDVFSFTDATNNHKWVRAIGHLAPKEEHKKRILRGIFQDITNFKNQEIKILSANKELELAHQFLDLALEGASLGIWDWDLITNNVTFDRRWAEMLGLNIHEIEMKLSTWERRVHPDDLESCYKDIQAYINGQSESYENVHRMKHQNGEWVYILDRGKFSAWDEQGKPIRFTGTHFNLTKQVLNEITIREISQIRAAYIEHIKDKKEFFQTLLDKIIKLTESEYGFIGEALKDEKGPYLKTFAITDISWNEETKLFYKDNAPRGLEFRQLDSLYGNILKSGMPLISNSPHNHPAKHGLPPGHPSLNSFMGVPIYHNEKMLAIVGVANRKEGYSESFLQQLNPILQVIGDIIYAQSLENEVEAQKNMAIHNAKLASVGLLAAGVGHEINNPLTIVIGQIELVQKQLMASEVYDSKIHDRFEKILSSCERISRIVKGLRSFSKTSKSDISKVNLVEIIQTTLALLENIFAKEQIKIEFIAKDDVSIDSNSGRMEQVLLNLLVNARDAIAEVQDKKIRINCFIQGQTAVLTVEDNGLGIDENLQEKIFEPFFTTKELNQGTGLGLAIVSSIVKDFGGTITAQSELGKGTKFIMKFPLGVEVP
jgi:signal transduction histidine kinase/PAS domain-containing protein